MEARRPRAGDPETVIFMSERVVSAEGEDRPSVRYFSFEEANRMLPLVRRIVEDITEEYRDVAPLTSRFSVLNPVELQTREGLELRGQVSERVAKLNELVRELQELGCMFKGFEEGLVDWYSLYAGRPVFLCWRLGETEIGWWHQLDAGFVGRQPILPSQREAFRGRR